MNEMLAWVFDTVQSVDPALRGILAGLAMLLETSAFVGLVVPGDAVVLLASTGVASVGGGIVLVALVVVGALVGETLGYALGRWFGPALQYSRVGRLVKAENWNRAQLYVQRRGGPAIFLSRFIPVLHSTVPMVAGMSGLRYRVFIAWTAPACLLWAGACVTAGSLLAGLFRDLAQNLHIAGYILVGVAVLIGAGVFGVKRMLLRAERRHFDPPAASPLS